ncbi:MAG: S8 family serine peptidase [Thermoplasmata archaeon]|nr:S8 family serine peptidase [Thermoplasmata archaeon]
MTPRRPPSRAATRCGASLVVVLFVALALFGAVGQAQPRRPTVPDPSAMGTTSAVYWGPFAQRAGYSASLLASVSELRPLYGTTSVVVTFRASNTSLFDVPAPGASALTVAEIGARFGLSPAAYQSAQEYFIGQGLTVEHVGLDRLSLTVGGPSESVGRAFSTSLVSGTYGGRAVSLPSQAPSLPFALEQEVAGVTGLSSGFDPFTLPLLMSPRTAGTHPAQGPSDLITPAIGRQIYGASDLYNISGSAHYSSGEKIVLLLWGDGYNPNDLQTFFGNDYPTGSFPSVTIKGFPIDGAPAPAPSAVNDPSAAPEELTLDLEWSGSFAPGATLDAVYAPDGPASDGYSPTDTTMADALHMAVTGIPGVNAISMSFGTAESTAAGLEAAWQTDLAEATQEQITLLGATGDTGGDSSISPGCSGVPQPEYPATNPDVLAVGGTDPTLARNVVGRVTGIAAESAWSGSGGGFSGQYPAPTWQEVGSAARPIEASGFRGTPDVSATAADNFVYFNGQQQSGAGTSFATPLWAGLVAEMDSLHGSSLGFLSDRLYFVGASEPQHTVPIGLVDITTGSNCIGPATNGWDTATGWGSPRALDLYAGLTATLVDLSIAATPSPVAPGGSVTVTAHLSNTTTSAPVAGILVLVTLTADTMLGPCVGEFGTATPTTNGTGDVAVSISIPSCYLGTHALVSVAVSSQGLFGRNHTSVGVNLLGYLGFLGPATTYPEDTALYVLIMAIAIAAGYFLGRGPPARKGGPRRRRTVTPRAPAPTFLPVRPAAPTTPPSAAPSTWVVSPPPTAPETYAPSPSSGTGSTEPTAPDESG